jgi:hypothetical protein
MTSFVHDELVAQKQLSDFVDNRPTRLRCVHPLVTLLEKLDALQRRVPIETTNPAVFVRHFEDAARIIAAQKRLPPLTEYAGLGALVSEMLDQKQLAAVPSAAHPSFSLSAGARTDAIRAAYDDIAPMFWGKRVPLETCCRAIREWLEENRLTST